MRSLNIFKRFVSIFLALTIVITHSYTAHAAGFGLPPETTNREKAHMNISFTGGGQESSPCTAASTPLSGNDNPEKAFRFFVSKGFTEKQAAGIIGNFMVESGVNPRRVQGSGVQESNTVPSSGGYGLAQWDNTPTSGSAGRRTDLRNFANKQNRPVYDLALQLDFVMFELNGKERGAYEAFKKTSSIQEATDVWRERYERPGEDATTERRNAANKAYGDFATEAGNAPGEPISTTSTASCGGSGDIVAIAQAELAKGVMEDPIGCDKDNPSRPGDCGKEVNKYTDNTLEYWCADFVSWVYKAAGKPFTGGVSGGWRIPSVEGVQAYMENHGKFTKNSPDAPDPQPGDIYVINNGEHVGIVVKVQGGKLYTISGNTSTENYSNGVGVGEAVYADFKSNTRITGYGGLR